MMLGSRVLLGVVLCAGALMLAASPLQACEDYNPDGPPPIAQLILSHNAGCLTKVNTAGDLADQYKALRPQIDVSEIEITSRQQLVGILALAGEYLGAVGQSLSSSNSAQLSSAYELMAAEVMQAADQVTQGGQHKAAYFSVVDGRLLAGRIDLREVLSRACGDQGSDECLEAYSESAKLLRHSYFVHATLLDSNVRLDKLAGAYENLDSKWDYYFETARSQYLWELGLNDWLYQRKLNRQCLDNSVIPTDLEGDALEEHCRNRWDVHLAEPPTGQWIVMHPNAAIEHVRSDDAGNTATRAVAIVELVGYNRFGAVRDNGWNPMGWPVGGSIVSTISLDSNGERFGLGAMLHLKNNLSLGVARNKFAGEYETTWLLSADLSKLFLDTSKEVRTKFRQFRLLD